jgi:mono/diheme cytochrome c family protein/glucose/arabinose dehydrogenase
MIRTYLNYFCLLFLAAACQQQELQQPVFDRSPEDRLDPRRKEAPYPQIEIPEGVDMESARWKGIDLTPTAPVIPLSPLEEQKTFRLREGYRMDPVLAEPHIQEPAAIQFDGNGRMYVLELRTYMQDIDATGELMPAGRISRWEDKDEDGIYETGVVFLDSLVFPRFVVPFGPNTILSMESNEDHVYKYSDTDGDGKADTKELFATGLGRSGNVEHQTSFLTWTMDNWMYSTYNSRRIRWTPEGVLQEPTGNPYGQWGVTQDNYGQVWFQDGAGGVPQNFNFPIVYGNFRIPGQFQDGFREPFSLVKLADFEPGMRETKPDGSLNNVTGAAGNDVFRGDRLPPELVNQYFYGEPVGRIVRQVRSDKTEGLTYIQNAYRDQETEFIQSTDPLFRPVDMATAPDGTMYIVDMYRGIIQEGNWTQEGSYLRTKIQQYQMDDIVGNGRIWRVSHEDHPRSTEKPRMFEESSEELLLHLSHPNGWWRDKAQQLLILRQDRSIVPKLEEMARNHESELARLHALWTLEGLSALKASLVREWLADSNPRLRIHGMRAGETLYKYGDKTLEADYRKSLNDPDPQVAVQALLSAHVLDFEEVEPLLQQALSTNPAKGIQTVAQQILDRRADARERAASKYSASERILFDQGKSIFDSYCATCHGVKGLGTPTGADGGELIAPGFSGSPRIQGHPEYAVKTLLHGLTGSIEGKEYEGVMIAMGENTNEWIASVVSYIRNDFGNQASFVSPEYVAQIRDATREREGNYSHEALVAEVPKQLFPKDNWQVSASSTALQGVGSTRDPSYAFGFKGWKTEEEQKEGMWFQLVLPQPKKLAEIQFDAGKEQYPGAYSIEVSTNGTDWTEVAHGTGEAGSNVLRWELPTAVSHLRLMLKEPRNQVWAMKNLTLYAR